ncbi:MAG: SDR family oxidoreductase [Bacteroidota bacterium]|nr:SDR family oxidoreductase [Bacteroidota bacterium]
MKKISYMIFYEKKVTIVTGASSGIGKASAIEFAKQGSNLVIVARDEKRLIDTESQCKIFGVEVLVVKADVSKEVDCKRIINSTIKKFDRIDVLVNNAGISMRALFGNTDLSVLKKVMDVNFWGTVYCTKFALPYLLKTNGSVVGVISTAGFRGLPGRTAYSASKFAINGFLETLRTEYLKTGLHVLIVAPGFTSSNIRVTALTGDGSKQGCTPKDESRMMTPEGVAKKLVRSVKKQKKYLIMTSMGRAVYVLNKFFPRSMDTLVYWYFSRENDSPFK